MDGRSEGYRVERTARYDVLRRAAVELSLDEVGAALASAEKDTSAEAGAQVIGLRCVLWWAGAEGGAPADPAVVQQLVGRDRETDAALGIVCTLGARSAYVDFDPSRLERWIGILGHVAGSDGELPARLRLAELWLAILRGPTARLHEVCTALADDCRRARIGDGLIDAQTCRALVACSLGEIDDGLSAARTACRMAKAEALPLQEILSHLVLARLRRVSGAPYLASRILRSLVELSPSPLRSWIEWERALAGAASSSWVMPESRLGAAVLALRACLDGAARDRRDEFERLALDAIENVRGFLDAWLELQDLLICADLWRDSEAGSVAASEWVRGARDMPPHGLHNVGLAMDGASSAPLAYVAAAPGSPARRVLAVGATLAMTPEGALLDRSARPQERTDTAAAFLLLSPGGELRDRAFFRALYGFDYDPALHKQILDSLVHRLKERLSDAAVVTRADGVISLRLLRPVVVWDPRCQRSLADTVLDTLARTGPMTARDTADVVGVSVRKVQLVLGEMLENESCVAKRAGRRVEYEVEDTVFSELTRSRFAAMGSFGADDLRTRRKP